MSGGQAGALRPVVCHLQVNWSPFVVGLGQGFWRLVGHGWGAKGLFPKGYPYPSVSVVYVALVRSGLGAVR